jgi:hypothetical protein
VTRSTQSQPVAPLRNLDSSELRHLLSDGTTLSGLRFPAKWEWKPRVRNVSLGDVESDAALYRAPIRFLLALDWMVGRVRRTDRTAFLDIIFGNVTVPAT